MQRSAQRDRRSVPVVSGAAVLEKADRHGGFFHPNPANHAGYAGNLRRFERGAARKTTGCFRRLPITAVNLERVWRTELNRAGAGGVPAQMVSMPLAGAASPVTLLGSVVQHAAESISGIAIHQLANPGAPIVWGGAPAIFDMRRGTTPMGAIETAMIDVSYAQVGKSLGLPTHTYLGASDAKLVDAQAGLESGMSALIGALAGINMISGAGMLDFLACFSPEKLVIDAEAIAMAQRLRNGVQQQTETLAVEMFSGIDFKGEFLKQKATRELFSKEQHLPSQVIDRDTLRGWSENGGLDAFGRARVRLGELINSYRPPQGREPQMEALVEMVSSLARSAGMEQLPETG